MRKNALRITIKEAELVASYIGSILECEHNDGAREIAEAIELGGLTMSEAESFGDEAALYLRLVRFLEQNGVDRLEHLEKGNQLRDLTRN